MKHTTISTVWTCDRCGVKKSTERQNKPSTASDAWAYFRLDQDSGWDMQGCAWAPRMREKMLFCGACAEEVVTCINTRPSDYERMVAARAAQEGKP